MATAVSMARPSAVFCGASAVELHGLPARETLGPLHLASPGTTRLGTQRRTFAVSEAAGRTAPAPCRFVHHLPSGLFVPVRAGAFRTVELPVAIIQVAASEPLEYALQVIDAALAAAGSGGVGRGELAATADRWPVRSQAERAAAAVALGNPAAESPRESLCRALFLLLGFETPVLQAEFFDERGFIGRVDFWWPSVGLVVEYDGEEKWVGEGVGDRKQQWELIQHDQQRHARLVAHPRVARVEHLTKADLRDPDALSRRLVNAGLTRDLHGAMQLRRATGQAA